MKIAYISPSFMSDVDLSLLPALSKDNCVDYFLILTPYNLRAAAINITEQEKEPGVLPVTVYPELSHHTKIVPPEHFFIVNDTGKHQYSPSSYKCYWKLYKFLKQQEYDIIHFTWPFSIPASILYLLRKRMVMTVHDPFPHSSYNNLYIKLVRKMAFHHTRHFILLNNSQKKEFISYYNLHDKNIYDSELSTYSYLHIYDDANCAPSIDYNQRYILMFGNIFTHKGADILLEAMDKIHAAHPDIKLVIAGRWKWNYEKKEHYNHTEYIDLLDRYIPDQELALLIKNSLFCICPYKDATQSGVVMSAFTFSKPVVATNVGGIPEMVLHDKYGIIVPPNNIEALAEAIIALLNSPDKISLMVSNITNDYNEGIHSWTYIADNLKCIYENVVKDYSN